MEESEHTLTDDETGMVIAKEERAQENFFLEKLHHIQSS